ncbi:MAG: ABC transporter substrate-binding protein [Erysipelotrichaceae bacterium]|nr:ABC transporter substrate-binding protein [Erysipelotrichaceae bacterium]
MKNKLIKTLFVGLSMGLTITSCGGNNNESSSTGSSHQVYNNETTPLVFASQDLDEVFNPFYYSTGPDGQIIGMTQISMFSTDKNADIAYGADEPVVVLDYEVSESDGNTTYTFVLKNTSYNVKFSNGSYVTLRDVLFNLYEYLDPQYAGSSTMYSTKILGLNEYRTQEDSEAGQEAFEEKFAQDANDRVNQLVTVVEEIFNEHTIVTVDDLLTKYLPQKEQQYGGNSEFKNADRFVEDFTYIGEEFKKELKSDFNSNKGTYEDNGLSNDIQTFFYVEGLITIDLDKAKDDPTRIEYGGFDDETIATYNDGQPMSEEQAIEIVYDYYFPEQFSTIANYWQTATTIRESFAGDAKEAYFENTKEDRRYKSISGIKVITEDTNVNNKMYKYALYNSDGSKLQGSDNGYEMFSITIEGVDPKAIWNFSFSVAPMYYYSTEELNAKFNYGFNTDDPCFGVEYGSKTFQTNVIKSESRRVPMGAGAYKATDKYTNLNSDEITLGTFFESKTAYFVRNDYFLMGKPKIKMIRYKVVPSNQMLNSLTQGEVHYCEPNAKKEIVDELNELASSGYSYEQIQTLGYGYIGINAAKIPSVYTRRAIMSAMNVKLTIDYYSGAAEILTRPMSKVSWAYPKNATTYYPYDSTGKTSENYLKMAGYTRNSQGKMVDKDGKQLKLTFTIAGEDTDHPTASTFLQAQTILNSLGCDIIVKPDPDALSKLNNGELAVWAAAWSTTIDPDMYQTYHIKSTATSTKNWGYDAFKSDVNGTTYSYEKAIVAELSEKIEEARETNNRDFRIAKYAECLDLVMDLAVELPTYQRNDLFAYNANVIDTSTLTPSSELSPYNGLINQIWNLSLVTK